MPLFVIILGVIFPRGIILLLWVFTNWFNGLFGNFVFPAIGFIFAPYTLLWFSAVQNWYGGTWELFQIAILVLALVADITVFSRKSK